MDERRAFVEALLRQAETMTALCARFGVPRKTGYKWRARFEAEGWAGLFDRSHVAKHLPHRTPPEVEAAVVALKRRRKSWGPKKLHLLFRERHPDLAVPAISTLGEILKRHGLVKARPRPAHRSPLWRSKELRRAEEPNEVWAADYKGEFRLGDGSWCYPLTIADQFSRYFLSCEALAGTDKLPAKCVFERAFKEFGLPEVIRTDNGSPFAANRGCLGLSELSLWWLRLGIHPERIDRGCPQQNGRQERLHRTLAEEAIKPVGRRLAEQQRRFDAYRRDYNEERPHEGLGQRRPASVYAKSPRQMPALVPPLEYPSGTETRRVDANGSISIERRRVFVSKVLALENVGLTDRAEAEKELWIGSLPVGYIDLEKGRLIPYADRTEQLEDELRPD